MINEKASGEKYQPLAFVFLFGISLVY